MSIFGDILDAAEGAAGMAGNTVKAAAKTVTAPVLVPAGVVWDIASSPGDAKQDVLQGGGKFVNWETSLLTDSGTFSGALAAPVMRGLEHVYREEISEPTAAAITDADRAWQQKDIGALFDDKQWDQAYQVAQNRSIGQAATLMLHNHQGFTRSIPVAGTWLSAGSDGNTDEVIDPFRADAYASLHKGSPFLTSLTSGSIDATVRWYVDPGLLGGKVIGAAKAARTLRPIKDSETAGLKELSETEVGKSYGVGPFKFTPVPGLKTRYDALTGDIDNGVHSPGWFDGKDAAQIYRGYKPLQEIDGGTQIASLFAQTNKIQNVAERINTRRTILRVMNGDVDTVADLQNGTQKFIADQLANIADGSVTGPQASTMADDVFRHLSGKGLTPPTLPPGSNPANIAEAERQIDNLPEITQWLQGEEQRLGTLLGTFDGAGQPGFVNRLRVLPIPGRASERAIGREEGQGILRGGEANTGYKTLNGLLDKSMPHVTRTFDSVYQASPSAMPVRVIHAVGVKPVMGLAKGSVQAPVKVFDSFRNARPEGFVNTNDADDTFRQLDAFLRKSGASPEYRNQMLDKLAKQTESYGRARVLASAEAKAHALVLAKHDIDAPEEFINEIVKRGQSGRSAILTSMQGRAYTATKSLDDQDLRVDQIMDDGVPTALPFLDTQDAGLMPMMDINVLDKVAKRHANVFRAAARSWREEADLYSPAVRSHLKRRAGQIGDMTGATLNGISDHMITLVDNLNRAWKFSVLFRLGYPTRVLMDDHFRIMAAFGASTIVNGVKSGIHNAALDLKGAAVNRAQLHSLQARHELLELKIPSDEILTRNREAYAQVRSIDKKLGKIKSAKRRQELEGERQAILDAHPEDLSVYADELNDIRRQLKEGTYKVPLRKMGDKGHTDEFGNYIPGAFEGTYGEVFRNLNASNQSWDRMGETLESEIHNHLSKGGSWTTLRAAEDPTRHVNAWAYAINNHLRDSELASIIIKGGDADDVHRFLTKTPRGREIVRRFPYHGNDPERWAIEIERMVDQYLPTAELRELAAKRRVSAKELDGMFKDVAQRPDVHGAAVSTTSEVGANAATLNHIYSKFYKFVGQKNDAVSRHPLFVSLYKDEMARQVPHRMAVAKAQGRELTSEDIEKVAHASRLYAKKHVTRTLFEMGSTSEMAHFLRFVSPFFGAWQEGLNRWWRIASRDPSVIRKFQMAFDMPRRLGLVVDQDGNPVKPGDSISDDHYILFQMPQAWGGPDPKDYQSQFKVSEASFNLIFQGGGIFNPGFGPIVQAPVNKLAVRNPENKTLQKLTEIIMPMGTRSDDMEMFTPNTLKYGWGYASAKFFGHHSAQYEMYQKQVLADMTVEWQQNHPNGRLTNQVLNGLIENSEDRVLQLMALRFVSASTSPASIQVQSKFTPQILAYRKLQDYAATNGKDSSWVDDQFIKQWGEAFFPLMQSTSSNPAHVDQSVQTVEAIKKNRHLLNMVDPSLYRMVIGHEGEGAFSYTARNYLATTALRPGSNEPFIQSDNPRDALMESAVSQGWYDYNQVMNKLTVQANAQGLDSYVQSDQLMEAKRKAVKTLAAHNAAWWEDYNSFNPAEYDAKVKDMETIASDPKLKADGNRTDVFALQQYLTLRNAVTQELQSRDAQGGSASPEANSNADLMQAFRQGVSSIVESNTWFSDYMFNGTIEHDPYLTVTTGTAAPAVTNPDVGTSGLVA